MNTKAIVTKLSLVALLSSVSLTNAGCWQLLALLDRDDEPATTDDYGYSSESLEVEAQSLNGDLGAVQDFDGNVYMEEGYEYNDVATMSVYSRNYEQDWNVMTAVTVEGGLDRPELEPGSTATFQNSDYTYSTEVDGQLHVSVLGCSGPAAGGWDFDRTADQVTVTVEEGSDADHRVMHYTATWDDGSQVQGAVEYRWN